MNAEMQSNKQILEAISVAQQEIAIVAIEKWKQEQKELLMKTQRSPVTVFSIMAINRSNVTAGRMAQSMFAAQFRYRVIRIFTN
jgi:hypothetical protein